MSRRVLPLAAAVVIILTACGTQSSSPSAAGSGAAEESSGAESQPAESPTATGLRVSTAAEILSLDPAYDNSGLGQAVLRNLFDPLVERDAAGDVVGVAAEEWEVVSDTVWQFTLRDGMTFHNGDPVTAADAAFSINRIIDPANESPLQPFIGVISEARATDELTLEVETVQPYTALFAVLPSSPIVPEAVVTELGEEGFAEAPIGSGPFQFVEWARDDHLTVEAYDDYWDGAPSMETVTFRPIPEPATRAAALQTDQVDLVMNLPEQNISDIENSDGLVVVVGPGIRTHQIILDTGVEPLNDASVRQAIQHAIDYDLLLETVLGGLATRNCQVVSPDTFGYDEDLECPDYDPDLARELLAEAGYPDGFEIAMGGANGGNPHDAEMQEAIVAMLADVGITVDLSQYETTRWVEGYREREWPMTYHTNSTPGDMEYVFGFGFYSETSRGYWQETDLTDALIEDSRAEFDPSAREEILNEISQIVTEQAAWVVIHNQADIWAMKDDLNFTPIPEKLNMAAASW